MFINYIKLMILNAEIKFSIGLVRIADAIKSHVEESLEKLYP